MSIVLVIALYAIWSSVFALGKLTLAWGSPLFLTGARMLLGALLLLPFLAWKKPLAFCLQKRDWISLGLLGIFSIYLANICEFWGLQYLSAAKACFIYSLSPFFAALLSFLHFREKVTGIKWFGFSISFLGILPVLFSQTGAEELFQTNFLSLPTLAVIGAAFFSVYGWILLRMNVKDRAISPLMANGTSMFIGGVLAITHSLLIESWTPLPIQTGHTAAVFQGIGIMTLLFNILCYNLYGLLLKRYTATFLAFVGLLSPIFASINGFLFVQEPFSWTLLLSTGIVSLGLWIVYRTELKQGYIIQNTST